MDCNDNDASIHPDAQEVKHDGIDQNCNGYDLTIDISPALYNAADLSLSVEASSSLGIDASLQLQGYGDMKWNRKSAKWKISVSGVEQDPGIVTVTGVEGSTAELTTLEETTDKGGGKGKKTL